MGAVRLFSCKACGYTTGDLFLGPAPYPDRYDPVLVSCTGCKVLKAIDRSKLAGGCRTHRLAYAEYDPEARVHCPRCGRWMKGTCTAIWD